MGSKRHAHEFQRPFPVSPAWPPTRFYDEAHLVSRYFPVERHLQDGGAAGRTEPIRSTRS